MIEILEHSAFFGVVLNLIGYEIGLIMKKKWKHPLCNPLLIAILFVIGCLMFFKIPYEAYSHSGRHFSYMLTPATICLAIPLYHQIQEVKDHLPAIILGIISGIMANLLVIFCLSAYFNLSYDMYVTLLPKSVTSAIGMAISGEHGGILSITAAAIIVTGIFGNICGELICKFFKIKDPVAKGVAYGTASHAIGTSKAMEIGEVEGAISSISIVLTGILTLVGVSYFSTLVP